MRILKIAGQDDFSHSVDVSITGISDARPNTITDEVSWKTNVQFRIELEYRSWGIKGITVTPFGMITIPVEVSDMNDERKIETLNITFDAGQLKHDEMPSDSVTLGEIELWVNPDLTPNYDRSTIVIYGPTRDR